MEAKTGKKHCHLFGPSLEGIYDFETVKNIRAFCDHFGSSVFYPEYSDCSNISEIRERFKTEFEIANGPSSSGDVLIGLDSNFENSEALPPLDYEGTKMWFLDRYSQNKGKLLRKYYNCGVDHVLTDFFPDEFEDEEYEGYDVWFRKVWLFFPLYWEGSNRIRKKVLDGSKWTFHFYEKVLNSHPYNSSSILKINSIANRKGQKGPIVTEEYAESLNASIWTRPENSDSIHVVISENSTEFLKMQASYDAVIYSFGSLSSPFINLLWNDISVNLRLSSSIRECFKKTNSWSVDFENERNQILSLFSYDYFLHFTHFILGVEDEGNPLRWIKKCICSSSITPIHGYPWELNFFQLQGNDRNVNWLSSIEGRRSLHGIFSYLVSNGRLKNSKLMSEYAILLIQEKRTPTRLAAFRAAFYSYDTWLEVCEDAVSSSNELKCKLSKWIRSSLLGKVEIGNPTLDVLKRCERIISGLAKSDHQLLELELIRAEKGEYVISAQCISDQIIHDESLKIDFFTELLDIAFKKGDFEFAKEISKSIENLKLSDLSWKGFLLNFIRKDSNGDIVCLNRELESLNFQGMPTTHVVNEFLQHSPDLLWSIEGKVIHPELWNLFSNLLIIDITEKDEIELLTLDLVACVSVFHEEEAERLALKKFKLNDDQFSIRKEFWKWFSSGKCGLTQAEVEGFLKVETSAHWRAMLFWSWVLGGDFKDNQTSFESSIYAPAGGLVFDKPRQIHNWVCAFIYFTSVSHSEKSHQTAIGMRSDRGYHSFYEGFVQHKVSAITTKKPELNILENFA